MEDEPMNNLSISATPKQEKISEHRWMTKGEVWLCALGVREELASAEWSLAKMVSQVVAPSVGLVCLYGLGGVLVQGRADIFLDWGGSRYVTPDEPILYLLAIVVMGIMLIVAMFLFLQDEG